MRITATPFELRFEHPFHLAAGVRAHTDTVILRLEWEGLTGFGEASLPPYLGETTRSVLDFIKRIDPKELDPARGIAEQLNYVDGLLPGNTAAKAAVDIALHDLIGKATQRSVSEMYALGGGKTVASTYTIGITEPAAFATKLEAAADFELIKLKLGSPDDVAIVKQFKQLSTKPFCVDVNQGWKDRGFAAEMVSFLHKAGALFIEQPMPKTALVDAAWMKSVSPLPIIADEAVQRFSDLAVAADYFDGVNIKLMKSTGIAEAHRMIGEARRLGLKVVIGCMAESSCAVAAASHLAPMADCADLDGPLLISNDPFSGLVFAKGRVQVPTGYGVGVSLV